MSGESAQQQVRAQIGIFLGLVVLALVSATITMVGDSPVIAIVMGIAAVQACLILMFLMHVKSEAASIKWLLAFSAFFLVVLFGLTLGALSDTIEGTESLSAPAVTGQTETGEEH